MVLGGWGWAFSYEQGTPVWEYLCGDGTIQKGLAIKLSGHSGFVPCIKCIAVPRA